MTKHIEAWGLFLKGFESSPRYFLEICVLQKSYFLWEFQAAHIQSFNLKFSP